MATIVTPGARSSNGVSNSVESTGEHQGEGKFFENIQVTIFITDAVVLHDGIRLTAAPLIKTASQQAQQTQQHQHQQAQQQQQRQRELHYESANAVLVPPLNFAMVAPGVYRSGHPNKHNFPFMRKLGLKVIV
ncbi:hypothetical protein BGZ99_008874 [Dissophora globulifera]|uniref:Uncharacterized protein n=1 Tax=Dissophora globulifera TaxID=979702 RepID=A0A9P6RR16_9FUNG|nr:hypothetical protein BGZ99_008874 [Dissophora globulifera]